MLDLYDESRDTFFTVSWAELLQHAALDDADRVRFGGIGVAGPNVREMSPFTACNCAYLPAGNHVSIVRNHTYIAANVVDPITYDATNALFGVAQGTVDAGMMLITTNNRQAVQPALYNTELQSFYTGSGFFNYTGTPGGGGRDRDRFIYARTLADWSLPMPAVAGGVYTDLERKSIFKMLAYGANDGAPVGGVLSSRTDCGLRPNLHIGRMVYADVAPDTMRFKHVAAHIIAQTVVTRSLAEALMQPVMAVPSDEMNLHILYLYGVHPTMFNGMGVNVAPPFLMANTALAYMTAAVLHPDTTVRRDCAQALKTNLGWDIQEIGNDLLVWL